MRTFAQKSKATYQTPLTKPTILSRSQSEQHRGGNSFLHLQRTMGSHAMQRSPKAEPKDLEARSASKVSSARVHDFSRIPLHDASSRRQVQFALKVNEPGDQYEQEADRVADQVMRAQDASVGDRAAAPNISRLPAISPTMQHQAKNEKEEELLQAKSAARSGASLSPGVDTLVGQALRGSGQPLPDTVRARMEPAFGADFSAVRLHAGGEASIAARAVHARAFTTGNDIVFGAGEKQFDTPTGKHLLAHELTHVVQQHGYVPSVQRQPVAEVGTEDEVLIQNYIHGNFPVLTGGTPAATRATLRRRAFALIESNSLHALRHLAQVARDATLGPFLSEVQDRATWVQSLMSRSAELVERKRHSGIPVSTLFPASGTPTGQAPAVEEMTVVERQAAHTQLVSRLGSAESNFIPALDREQNAIESAADAEGELLKLVVGAAFSFFVTPGIGRALSSLANTISVDSSITTYRIAVALQDNAPRIAGTISSVAKPRATEVIHDAGQPPTEYEAISERLLTGFQVGKDELVGYVGRLITNRNALPDEDLLLLVAAWDPRRRTRSVYSHAIRDVLQRFRDQVLRIGERRTTAVGTFYAMGARRSIRWVRFSSSRRLAVVSIRYPGGGHGSFISWVDPAFERAAVLRWHQEPIARNAYGGRIDADQPQTVAPEEIGAPSR